MGFLSHGTRVPIVHRGLVFCETLNETLKVRIPQWLTQVTPRSIWDWRHLASVCWLIAGDIIVKGNTRLSRYATNLQLYTLGLVLLWPTVVWFLQRLVHFFFWLPLECALGCMTLCGTYTWHSVLLIMLPSCCSVPPNSWHCLSPYQWLFPYLPVRYIGSQSSGTVGLGLHPLCLVTLLARVSQQYIRCTTSLLGP